MPFAGRRALIALLPAGQSPRRSLRAVPWHNLRFNAQLRSPGISCYATHHVTHPRILQAPVGGIRPTSHGQHPAPPNRLLPCGSDPAGSWTHTPDCPTCTVTTSPEPAHSQIARNTGSDFPPFCLFHVQNGPTLVLLQLTQIPVHGYDIRLALRGVIWRLQTAPGGFARRPQTACLHASGMWLQPGCGHRFPSSLSAVLAGNGPFTMSLALPGGPGLKLLAPMLHQCRRFRASRPDSRRRSLDGRTADGR